MSDLTLTKVSGVVTKAKKATDSIESMAKHAEKITKGVAQFDNVRKYIKYAKLVGKVGSALGIVGAGISLLMVFTDQSDEDEVTKGIKQIQDQISDLRQHLDDQFDLLSDEIDISNAKTAIMDDFSVIDTASENMRRYREAKEAGNNFDIFESNLLNTSSNDLQKAVKNLRDYCSSDALTRLLSSLYDVSYGNVMEIYRLGHQILSHAIVGASVDGMVTVLQQTKKKRDNGKTVTDQDITSWQGQVATLYEDDLVAVAEEVELWLDNCLKKHKINITNYMNKKVLPTISVSELVSAPFIGSGYVRASFEIMTKLATQFSWYNFAVIVYDPVTGYSKHGFQSKGSNVKAFWRVQMKDGNANVIIRWLGRKESDKTIHTQTHVSAPSSAKNASEKFINGLVTGLSTGCGEPVGVGPFVPTLKGPPSRDACKGTLGIFKGADSSEAPPSSMYWYLRAQWSSSGDGKKDEIKYGFASLLPVFHASSQIRCGFIGLGIYPFS
jgi:hypothetical protein